MRRIHELKENEVGQQHGRLAVEAAQQPQPVDGRTGLAQDVGHVAAVEPFAFHHERLRPDDFFGGHQMHRHVEHHRGHAVREPVVVDFDEPVPAGKNQVDEVSIAMRLAKPMRKHQFAADALRREGVDDARPVGATKEQVEIFGMADQTRMVLERVGATDQVRNSSLPQVPQDRAVDIRRADIVRSVESGATHAAQNANRVPTRASKGFVRLAAVGDLHYGKASRGSLQPLFAALTRLEADILVLCGDLTDYGLPDEATELARELVGGVKIPIVGVLGNHDYHSDAVVDIQRILTDAGVHLLDGETVEVQGVGFAGVKGFAGGFGRGALGPWGEEPIKRFVREAVDEALKLESALARLRTATRIAVLHYAPVAETVEGEPREIYPYLGCSRLEEPLARYQVTAVFHGHAHHGTLTGKTSSGTPVYNVSLPLLLAANAEQPVAVLDVALATV